MDFDMPSPSKFPSSSQWARACTRPAYADTSGDLDVGVVQWVASQSTDPVLQKLIEESAREEERKRRSHSSASAYTSTWTPSTTTSTSSTTRTASLPTFSVPSSSSTLPCRASAPSIFVSTSGRRLLPRKSMSKKVPPSRAYLATAHTKDEVPLDPEKTAELLLLMGRATWKADQHSRLKQAMNEKVEKAAASGTSGVTTTRKNTVPASSSGSRFASAASTARPLTKMASTPTIPRASASAPSRGGSISKTLSSTTIKPIIKLSRYSGTDADVEMTIDSDRDTDLECSTFTDSPGSFTTTDTLNESFSMHVDDIVPPPTERAIGRVDSASDVCSTPSSTISLSNSGYGSSFRAIATASSTVAASLEKMPQSTHLRPPVSTSATQRRPPPLGMRRPPNLPNTGFPSSQSRYAITQSPYTGMRRPPNLPNTGFPSSQSRYAITQSPYTASQAKGQKQVTLPPFKPPLLSKPNPKPVNTPKQISQNPESTPTSTPELEMDDGENEGGAAVADSSFDVSFDVDADALEATMRQYD